MGSVNPHPPSQRNAPPLINSLHKAILSNDYHGVRILIAPNKNNVDQRLEAEGATFLMVAVLLGRLKIATLTSPKLSAAQPHIRSQQDRPNDDEQPQENNDSVEIVVDEDDRTVSHVAATEPIKVKD
ncbi:uncharacterized protein CTHT_0071190 [Thermochaetoides thermophila DSM 1495]|uniref:Ankyrin repeat-containing protein n=1 Tax=Chaetomium thermophilum (strain DSM 1495 / CBS 144.50 / IMI 039719) TaxID=759272 RepID=G0SFK7_CHATD|nr:hypothetical protein CTHT_0071190 [Thermochaetoides thermophila DSM 1495]EGS17772.1 hypothetical protein CTHT_0071190 [Thermochaetoides thermophila DSM 1495]